MEEMYYPTPEKPQYSEKIRRIRNSDPLSLNKTVNRVIEALIGNIAAVKADLAPTGSIFWHAAATPPSGYLICDGSEISRTDYANLFNVIGTAFGEGDGETTFALPDLRAKFIRGAGESNGYAGTFGKTQDATSGGAVLYNNWAYNLASGQAGRYESYEKLAKTSGASSGVSPTSDSGNTYYRVWFRPYNIALTPIIRY